MLLAFATRLLPVWGFLKRNPLLCLCVILALWGAWERNGKTKWHNRAIACETASQAAAAQTKAMRETERKSYQEKARHADQEHEQALADVRGATDNFIARNRVRPARHISAPAAVDQASNPVKPAPVPSGAFVAITDADMQACSAATAYAVNAHDYLMSIGD